MFSPQKTGAEAKNLGAYFFTSQPHPYGKTAFEKQVFVQCPSGGADKAKSEPISEFGFACFGGADGSRTRVRKEIG